MRSLITPSLEITISFMKGADLSSSPVKTRKAEETQTSKCRLCDEPVSETGIQCGDCRTWYHYGCSKLPVYQLYIFEVSQRRYSCENYSMMDDDFLKKCKSETPRLSTTTFHLISSKRNRPRNTIQLQLKTEEYSKETESLKQKCFKVNLDKESKHLNCKEQLQY